MKKIVLITALTAALVAQPTQCVSWKNLAIGTVIATVGMYLVGSYFGWFAKTNKEMINNVKKDDNQNNKNVNNNVNTNIIQKNDSNDNNTIDTIDESFIDNNETAKTNDKNTINLDGGKIMSDLDKQALIEKLANSIEVEISQEGNDTSNQSATVENLIKRLETNDPEIIIGVLKYKFKNNKNLLETSGSKGALRGSHTTMEMLYKKHRLLEDNEKTYMGINKNITNSKLYNKNTKLIGINELKNNLKFNKQKKNND